MGLDPLSNLNEWTTPKAYEGRFSPAGGAQGWKSLNTKNKTHQWVTTHGHFLMTLHQNWQPSSVLDPLSFHLRQCQTDTFSTQICTSMNGLHQRPMRIGFPPLAGAQGVEPKLATL